VDSCFPGKIDSMVRLQVGEQIMMRPLSKEARRVWHDCGSVWKVVELGESAGQPAAHLESVRAGHRGQHASWWVHLQGDPDFHLCVTEWTDEEWAQLQ
jgi:hypothetical protein